MPELFSVPELIDVAIREEQTGAAFYRAVAAKTGSPELKEFVLRVAAMEDEHERIFRELLDRVGAYEKSAQSYAGEYEAYMGYLLEGRIFPSGAESEAIAARLKTDSEAIDTALEMERSTLLFYHEMAQFVADKDRPLLDGIINEERQHLTAFARYKAEHA